MNDRHLIVVSAENNPYMAWQCKLFHFSCTSRLGLRPLIVVHETGAPLHDGFLEAERAGARLLRAPSYKLTARGDSYPPRNTAGTLLHAAGEAAFGHDFIVLCDPDMIFTRAAEFPARLSGDYCSYVKYDHDFVDEARRALGIPRGQLDERKERLRCGVPYVIPAGVARPLAEGWLEAIDAFRPRTWEDVMYAFGLACVRLGLEVSLTRMATSNYWPDAILKADVVHYCYGDERWSKRHYFRAERAEGVWETQARALEGTVLAEILSQIRGARDFYSSL